MSRPDLLLQGSLGNLGPVYVLDHSAYGDVSGFSGCVQRFWLARIVRDPLLRSRILFGTDYPAFVHVFRPNRGNTFAAWTELFRSFGLGDEFFARGAKLIGLEDRK